MKYPRFLPKIRTKLAKLFTFCSQRVTLTVVHNYATLRKKEGVLYDRVHHLLGAKNGRLKGGCKTSGDRSLHSPSKPQEGGHPRCRSTRYPLASSRRKPGTNCWAIRTAHQIKRKGKTEGRIRRQGSQRSGGLGEPQQQHRTIFVS